MADKVARPKFYEISTQAELIAALTTYFQQLGRSPQVIQRFVQGFQNPGSSEYGKSVDVLRAIPGFKESDEYRILRYRDGRYRSLNTLNKYTRIQVSNIDNYLVIDFEAITKIKQNLVTLTDSTSRMMAVPVYYDNHRFYLLDDSEFFLVAQRILVISNLDEAVSTLSNHRVEQGTLKTLTRFLPQNIDLVIDRSNGQVYNRANKLLELTQMTSLDYVKTLTILNSLKQPYRKQDDEDEILKKFVANHDVMIIVNQLLLKSYLYDAAGSIYREFGLDLCNLPNIAFAEFNKHGGSEELRILNETGNTDSLYRDELGGTFSWSEIGQCHKKYALIGIGIYFYDGTQGKSAHQMAFLLNTHTGHGYLFDPSYAKDNTGDIYVDGMIRIIKRNLAPYYPDLKISSTRDISCPYLYSMQGVDVDVYCISWSYYILILYLLNENLGLDEVVNRIYSVGQRNLLLVIARFMIGRVGTDIVRIFLEADEQHKKPK